MKKQRIKSTVKERLASLFSSNEEKQLFFNMAKLTTGEGIGRLIGILTTPIITRIYSPSEMGVMAVFISLIAIVAPFGTFRYSLAIPLPKHDNSAINIVCAALCFLSLTSVLLIVTLLIGGKQILMLLSMESIISYIWLIPIAFLGHGIFELLSQWGVRKKAFTALTKTSVKQKIIGVIAKIGLGLVGIKPLGLIVGDLLNEMGGITSLLRTFRKDILLNKRFISRLKIRYVLRRYSSFPKYRIPSQLLLLLAGNIPIFFFAWKFDSAATGQIALARTMLSIPVTFIGYSVGKVFFAEIAAMGSHSGQAIYLLTRNVIKNLTKLSLVPFSIIILLGPFIFRTFFGVEWNQAGVYARIMAFYLLVQFVYSPISDGIFNVFERQSFVFLLELSRFFIILMTFLLANWLNWDALDTVSAYSAGLFVQYSISLFVVINIIKKSKK